MSAPELCRHGCVGWCATCDWEAAHPEGFPVVRAELPGRGAVTCPRKGCGHPLAKHKDGICTADRCGCGLPAPRSSGVLWAEKAEEIETALREADKRARMSLANRGLLRRIHRELLGQEALRAVEDVT